MTSRLSTLADYLRSRHDDDHVSWRRLRDLEYPGISHTVLRDLAVVGKVPRERRILQVLGLVAEPRVLSKHEKRVRRKIGKMSKQTREPELYEETLTREMRQK